MNRIVHAGSAGAIALAVLLAPGSAPASPAAGTIPMRAYLAGRDPAVLAALATRCRTPEIPGVTVHYVTFDATPAQADILVKVTKPPAGVVGVVLYGDICRRSGHRHADHRWPRRKPERGTRLRRRHRTRPTRRRIPRNIPERSQNAIKPWDDRWMDHNKVREAVRARWDRSVLPSLSRLVEIPALSPAYDASWERNGHLRAAVEHVRAWVDSRDLAGARCDVVQLDGRAPLLLVDVPATAGSTGSGTVLLYGHLDKQPPQGDWSDGLGPWEPVVRDGRLYGRGTADDGYSGYAATTALEAAREAGGEHARAVLLLETGEESGSPDLPAYLEHLADRLGEVSLVICLDAGGGDYERLWLTASLRGIVQATVTVRVLETASHSGLASGIVPSSFRIMRRLLDRVEDAATGEVKIPEMNVPIPAGSRRDAEAVAALDPGASARRYPLVPGMGVASDDEVELILNNTWRPSLSVIGAAGLPDPADAGAVLRASTSLRLSLRIPPTVDAETARTALVRTLTTDVPYGAYIEVGDFLLGNGWHAPAPAPWLAAALDEVGDRVFGKACAGLGIGGGIPFMELLSRRYPGAQFVVTGALGADSNAHVPDEWLHIAHARRVTEAVAHILNAHASQRSVG